MIRFAGFPVVVPSRPGRAGGMGDMGDVELPSRGQESLAWPRPVDRREEPWRRRCHVDPRPGGISGTAMRTHLEVHDPQNENRNCQIDEIIRAGNAVTFSPDTIAQANS